MSNGKKVSRTGVLPDFMLRNLLGEEFIRDVDSSYVNPSSVDIPLSSEVFRLEARFLPQRGERVRPLIKTVGGTPHDLRSPLEVGRKYLIRAEGRWRLPAGMYGYANPKSSAGRIGLLSRIVADGSDMYDAMRGPENLEWEGEVWILVEPKSFPILLSPRQAISQFRLFTGKAFVSPEQMKKEISKGLLYTPDGKKIGFADARLHADSVLLSIDLSGETVGWECRGIEKVLDYGKVGFYDPEDFFTRLEVRNGCVAIREGTLAILSTYEHLVVPPAYSSELRAIDPRFGEFRNHSAGFFDAGWGVGKGAPITLEVTTFEGELFRDRRVIGRVRYEYMAAEPLVPYRQARSNYTDQTGPRLSKHFKIK